MVSRSFAARKTIMPPSANSASGNTSVCRPGAWYWTGSPPGAGGTGLAKAPPSTERSAISNSAPKDSASRVPHRNNAG